MKTQILNFLATRGSKIIVPALMLSLSIASCKKPDAGPEGPAGPQGPGGPALSGSLKGYVNHYDVSGAKVSTNLANDSVFLDGTSSWALTDANGLFSFSNLTTGVYNITVKKTGSNYGLTKIQNIEFAGNGDTYRNASISETPTTSVSSFTAKDTTINGINYVKVKGSITASPKAQSVIVFVNVPGNNSVNSLNYSSYYVINVAANATSAARNIPTSDLYDLGFASGNTVYFDAHVIGSNTQASAYVDFTDNRTIFTAINATGAAANAPVQ